MARLVHRPVPADVASSVRARLQRWVDRDRPTDPEEAALAEEHPWTSRPSTSPVHGDAEVGSAGAAQRVVDVLRGGRLALSGPAATGLVLLAVAALALAASYAVRARSAPVPQSVAPTAAPVAPAPAPATTPAPGATPGAAGGAPSPAGVVVVDVAGDVRSPGVVRLPAGSRVVDAIAAAGGARAGVDLSTLNLARVLVDGEQVLVGATPGAGPTPAPTGGATTPPGVGPTTLLDLNTATYEQLDTLPGVGPVLAQRILDWRAANGRFSTIEELREVSGIGDARFADLAPRVRV